MLPLLVLRWWRLGLPDSALCGLDLDLQMNLHCVPGVDPDPVIWSLKMHVRYMSLERRI